MRRWIFVLIISLIALPVEARIDSESLSNISSLLCPYPACNDDHMHATSAAIIHCNLFFILNHSIIKC